MKKWWMAAALAALVVAQAARAQVPPHDGGGLLPEPAPVAPSGNGQQFMPGPLPAAAAPPGPDDGLSLPGDIPTAWGKGPPPEEGAYLTAGSQGLMRQRPSNLPIATTTDGGFTAVSAGSVNPNFSWGPSATIGYLFDNAAIEVTGFYEFPQDAAASAFLPRGLSVPFFNAPLPFLVDRSGVWDNVTAVKTDLQYTLGDVELNYRWWSRALTGVEGILGLRYMHVQESVTITTDAVDQANMLHVNGFPFQTQYSARATNDLFMPQTGIEWEYPIRPWVSFGILAKAAIGANDIEVTRGLSNGTGLVASLGKQSKWTWTSMNEVNAYLDFIVMEKMRLRLGYSAIWLLNVADGYSQVNFDLGAPVQIRDNGSIFYHGPRLELEFFF